MMSYDVIRINGIMNEMTGLSYISLNNGPLKELPENICELHPELKVVYILNNSLRSINLQNCKSMVFLLLDLNRLKEVPDVRGSLGTLRAFSADFNQIHEQS